MSTSRMPPSQPHQPWSPPRLHVTPDDPIRQQLTTTGGVQVRVKDPRPPEPEWEPPPEEQFQRVIIVPDGQPEADRQAFLASLDSKWSDKIARAFERGGINPASARDLAQRVLLIVCTREKQGKLPPNVEAYINGVIPKVASNHRALRKLSYQQGADIEALADAALDPEQALARAEYGAKLLRYLTYLPTAQADVIRLMDLEMLTIEEAAEALDRPHGTVASQRRRALRKLREYALESERGTSFGAWLQTEG